VAANYLSIFTPALQDSQPLAVRILAAALDRGALSNAYLVTGRILADKWLLAQQLACFLNCLKRKEDEYFSCLTRSGSGALDGNACSNCRWIRQGEHPKAWLRLIGEGKSGHIPVEKARQLTAELGKTSPYMRVVIIPDAQRDCLSAAPANALLKSIEEPPDNVVFLLFAVSSEPVLQTIVSRSQLIPVTGVFKPGLWTVFPKAGSPPRNSELSCQSLARLRFELMQSARQSLSTYSGSAGSNLKAFCQCHELSDRLIGLADPSRKTAGRGSDPEALSDAEPVDPALLIDLCLDSELEVLRQVACRQTNVCIYLKKLAELAEISKSQLDSYVKDRNVLETFACSLGELRARYLGDFCLAKE
jgi:hypothetical protein